MTRINISYLLALGLLGTAVACTYTHFALLPRINHDAATATVDPD
jgi:hypothetical protein